MILKSVIMDITIVSNVHFRPLSQIDLFIEVEMRKACLFIAAVSFLLSTSLIIAQQTPDPCTSGHEFATTDCTLTWHGITLYGAYDTSASAGSATAFPENGYNYEGESLVNRNGYQHRFLVAPNNMQQTGVGIKGKAEFRPGWFVVFNASTGINPQSGLLANASATQTANNGLPRNSYSFAIDGAPRRSTFPMTNTMAEYRLRISAS